MNQPPGRTVISGKRRNALVASGGGLKAHFFHIGVAMRLEKEGFKFKGGVLNHPETELRGPGEPGNRNIDMYIGSSGGALFSIGTALGYSPAEMFELFMDDRRLRRAGLARGVQWYLSLNTQAFTELAKSVRRALRNGWDPEAFSVMSPVSLGKLEKRLHRFLKTEDFRRLTADLFVVATPLNSTGRIVYCRKPLQLEERVTYRNDADISSAVAASCSLQFLHPFNVRHHNGEQIDEVDGETRKTLSHRLAADNGADLVFVSYTHVPYHFNPVTGSIKKYGMLRTAIQSVYLMIEEKILSSQELTGSQNRTLDILTEEFGRMIEEMPGQREILERHREGMRARLVEGLGIKPGVDYCFIKPDQNDADFFFTWHMGMSKDYIKTIVQKGYEAAERELQKYQFK